MRAVLIFLFPVLVQAHLLPCEDSLRTLGGIAEVRLKHAVFRYLADLEHSGDVLPSMVEQTIAEVYAMQALHGLELQIQFPSDEGRSGLHYVSLQLDAKKRDAPLLLAEDWEVNMNVAADTLHLTLNQPGPEVEIHLGLNHLELWLGQRVTTRDAFIDGAPYEVDIQILNPEVISYLYRPFVADSFLYLYELLDDVRGDLLRDAFYSLATIHPLPEELERELHRAHMAGQLHNLRFSFRFPDRPANHQYMILYNEDGDFELHARRITERRFDIIPGAQIELKNSVLSFGASRDKRIQIPLNFDFFFGDGVEALVGNYMVIVSYDGGPDDYQAR